jgi:hypothetical protein
LYFWLLNLHFLFVYSLQGFLLKMLTQTYIYFLLFCYLQGVTEGLNSGLPVCEEYALPLEPYIQPFFNLLIFERGSPFLSRPLWTSILHFKAYLSSWDDRQTSPCPLSLFPLRWCLENFSTLTVLELWSFQSQPTMQHGWHACATPPSYWLRWSPLDLSLPSI